MEIFSFGTPAWPKRSTMWLSTPQVIGLTKPSGGGGVNAELIFSNCETKDVGSLGIQLPITMRPPRLGDPHHLLGDIEGLGRKHGAKHGERQVKRVVGDAFQIGRVAFLKLQVVQTRFGRPLVPGFDEVPGNVDSQDVGPQTGERQRRRAIAAAEVQHPKRRRDPEGLRELPLRSDA